MQKGQTFKTPTRKSSQKRSQKDMAMSQNLSQSQKASQFLQQHSQFMSKQLSFAHSSFPVKCLNQAHCTQDVHFICLKEDCDKPFRLACQQCIKGHHSSHFQEMIRISEFLNNENKEQLPFQVQNWPISEIGKEIREYIEGEEEYIQSLYDGIENTFNSFMQKVQIEVNKMKQNMQADVANYYKKGPGKKRIDFVNQLKDFYVDSYGLQDLQQSIKDFVNRGLQAEIFDTRVEYFLNSQQFQQARAQVNNFYLKNKINEKFELDFNFLKDIQKDITENIHKCRKVSDKQRNQEFPKTGQTDLIPWYENFHSMLNYLNIQYKNYSPDDIIQYKAEQYADGSKYEGFFVNGYRDIIGTRYYIDGSKYVGEFSRGARQGNGILHYYKGNMYQGQFHNDKKDGLGLETYTNGAVYEGYFSGDLKHGQGRYQYSDGRVFEGFYSNDKRDDKGLIYYKNGKVEDIYYRNGQQMDIPTQDQLIQQDVEQQQPNSQEVKQDVEGEEFQQTTKN